jgi:Amt family ammonium transporter
MMTGEPKVSIDGSWKTGLRGLFWGLALVFGSGGGAIAQDAVLDSGDTAWMVTSTALVLMMTIPGLAMFYGGLVRKKNVLSIAMQVFAACCLATLTSTRLAGWLLP